MTVADPSRLIVDVLDSTMLGGGPRHALDIVRHYWQSAHAAPHLLLDYAEQDEPSFPRVIFNLESSRHSTG